MTDTQITTQEPITKLPEVSERDARGRFAAGNNINPGGKPKTGYQDGRTRFNYLAEHFTIEEIDAMVMNKNKRRKLLYRDGLLLEEMSVSVMQVGKNAVARGYSVDEVARARRFCIEQYMGKAASTVLHGGAKDAPPIAVQAVPLSIDQAAALYRQALLASEQPLALPPPAEETEEEETP